MAKNRNEEVRSSVLVSEQPGPRRQELTQEQLRALVCVPIAPVTADEIRDFRRKLGWTQEQFAAAYRLSVETVRAWEQGKKEPGSTAHALLSVLRGIVRRAKPAERGRSRLLRVNLSE
jgi:DNA-binding transcriptional regulator YiaG